uniref:Deleted in malignant brain tumors 1 protein n=1 Tax=Magallana gigas TaxID=29159 RepID=K1QTU6_MAGGI
MLILVLVTGQYGWMIWLAKVMKVTYRSVDHEDGGNTTVITEKMQEYNAVNSMLMSTASYGNTSVRLIGSEYPDRGTIEVLHNGRWGTICDEKFDKADGDVICRMMGFNISRKYFPSPYYGSGIGSILLDNVRCSGFENDIAECGSNGWGKTDCSHGEDAGVHCENKISLDVRLVESGYYDRGRVEVYLNGQWGTICDDRFNKADGDVICRMLGFNSSTNIFGSAHYGTGSGPILYQVNCNGYETDISECGLSDWGTTVCGHHEDVGVDCGVGQNYATTYDVCYPNPCQNAATCSRDYYYSTNYYCSCPRGYSGRNCEYYTVAVAQRMCGDVNKIRVTGSILAVAGVRLVGSEYPDRGTVEVLHNGRWGTICGDYFNKPSADVICRMLGYNFSRNYFSNAYYGFGAGQVWLDDVSCNGYENDIAECESQGWGRHDCTHGNDTGVHCGSTCFDRPGVSRSTPGFVIRICGGSIFVILSTIPSVAIHGLDGGADTGTDLDRANKNKNRSSLVLKQKAGDYENGMKEIIAMKKKRLELEERKVKALERIASALEGHQGQSCTEFSVSPIIKFN